VVWRRDKKGFPTPVGNWLRDGRGRAAIDVLRDPSRRSRDATSSARTGIRRMSPKTERSWQLARLSTELAAGIRPVKVLSIALNAVAASDGGVEALGPTVEVSCSPKWWHEEGAAYPGAACSVAGRAHAGGQ
jgi:hypothetical protein